MAKNSKFTKFVKRNKVLTVLIVLVLLAVIIVPSVYFGLKNKKANSSSSQSNNTQQAANFIDIFKSIENVKSNTHDISKYNTDNIYIRFKNLLTNDLQEKIDTGVIHYYNTFKIITLNTINSEIIIEERINTNDRRFILTIRNRETNNVEKYKELHLPYYHTNKYIDIEIMILNKKDKGETGFAYNVYQTNAKGVHECFYSFRKSIKLLKPIKNYYIERYPYDSGFGVNDPHEIERHDLSSFILKTNVNDFPTDYMKCFDV
jgi:hypothetical protein